MKFFEAKDTVREHFSRTAFPTSQLILSLSEGRAAVERHANWWWMKKEKDFSLVVDQSSYSITTSTSNGLNLPKFKDARALVWKLNAAATQWDPVEIGTMSKPDADLAYATDGEGSPDLAIVDDTDLFIYPPKPQETYVMRLYHYEWTDNPVNTSDDDLLKYFPMALVYASMAWGYEMCLKSPEGALYWKFLLGGKPFGSGGLLAQMKKENFKRGQQDRIVFEPRTGPGRLQYRRLSNVQGYR